jgi:hypothetical protein
VSIVFVRAAQADDAEIRRLLRENPLGGRFSISLERHPTAFSPSVGEHDYVLARDGPDGPAIGLYERTVWPAFVNGRIERLPYLGALRVAESHRRRIAILRSGYASLRDWFGAAGELPYSLTSITADNDPALRILTAGLKGLPIYRPFARFSTFVLRPGGRADPAVGWASEADLPELVAFLASENARFQFAAHWSAERLRGLDALGLPIERILLHRSGGRITGCVALWDQRGYRQSVIRSYPPAIRNFRRAANLLGPLLRLPRLPVVGDRIEQVVLSHLAVEGDDPDILRALVGTALSEAKALGFEAAILGLASERPLRKALLKNLRAIEYETKLYLVHWPDAEAAIANCDDALPHPEIGLL